MVNWDSRLRASGWASMVYLYLALSEVSFSAETTSIKIKSTPSSKIRRKGLDFDTNNSS